MSVYTQTLNFFKLTFMVKSLPTSQDSFGGVNVVIFFNLRLFPFSIGLLTLLTCFSVLYGRVLATSGLNYSYLCLIFLCSTQFLHSVSLQMICVPLVLWGFPVISQLVNVYLNLLNQSSVNRAAAVCPCCLFILLCDSCVHSVFKQQRLFEEEGCYVRTCLW